MAVVAVKVEAEVVVPVCKEGGVEHEQTGKTPQTQDKVATAI